MANMDKMMKLAEALQKQLPHGSGFNGNWEITVKPDRVKCFMVYDHMNECGMYDAYLPFTVTFFADDFVIHFNRCNSRERYIIRRDMMKEYFEDVFAEVFEDARKEK